LKAKQLLTLFLFFSVLTHSFAQTATINGVVLDEKNKPIENVTVTSGKTGTTTNVNGFYTLEVPANKDFTITFTHVTFKKIVSTFNLKNGENFEFYPVMSNSVEQISAVIVSGNRRKEIEGVVTLDREAVKKIPGANAGVENLLLTLPGVSNNNELSTQYSVRGGNYDENLVYVNGIEVYRPFLVRSGQQEGLSFVNTDLVQNVDFSAGGFQAKYGDKLSSVLDITYKDPYQFEINADLSLLGGSFSIENLSKDSKFSSIVGLRYRDNSLLVNAKETQTNFRPTFADAQGYFKYKFSNKFHLSFLGSASINKYNFEPQTRQTNFGTLSDPVALLVFYDGQEKDRYQTFFGAFKGSYFANDDLTLHLIASTYHTTEEEYFDILAQYRLGEVNSNIGDENLGEVEFSQGIGSQLNHGRNDLDALITNIEHKGDFRPPKTAPNDQPYESFTGPLEPFQNARAINDAQINRFQAYAQWSKRSTLGSSDVWYNAGVRAHNWSVSGVGISSSNQTVFSPRAQFTIKPYWEKDMLFRVAGGLYYQPPFYRELRDMNGTVQPNVKAQKSIKTEENINNRGYISRPTDQRLKFAALFQDYVPNMPNLKMYLNVVYNTGLPGGSPSYADPYDFQNRLPAYKRADLGLQYVLVDSERQFKSGWKKPFKALSFGFEIFNIFDVQNSITNTWVRDVSSKRQIAIPNFLTPRVFNVRTTMKF